jgi:cinnamyl-alcohol dehydrogenase
MSSETANENCLGWAARDASGVLSPFKFSRRYVYLIFSSRKEA